MTTQVSLAVPATTGACFRTDLLASPLQDRISILQGRLRQRVGGALNIDPGQVSVDVPFIMLNKEFSDPKTVNALLRRWIREDLGLSAYPVELMFRYNIRYLAEYLAEEVVPPSREVPPNFTDLYADGKWAWEIPNPSPPPVPGLPGMVLLLSVPRSGSTLLRTILAGHSALFSPPELNLLPFASMGERGRQIDSLGYAWMRSGPGSAFAALEGLSPKATEDRLARLEKEDVPIPDVYRMLQEGAGDRRLVDKSPLYTAHPAWLSRAEHLFQEPRFLCLARHPYAMIESFVRMRFYRFLGPHWLAWDDNPWLAAEKSWATGYRHLLDFAARVGPQRIHWVKYEELVANPTAVMAEACRFLQVPFEEAMVDLQRGERMTRATRSDGMAPEPTVGDPNVLLHERIDARLATRWRDQRPPQRLSPPTRAVAAELGYELAD
jgi:hypothetical protein